MSKRTKFSKRKRGKWKTPTYCPVCGNVADWSVVNKTTEEYGGLVYDYLKCSCCDYGIMNEEQMEHFLKSVDNYKSK